MLIFLSSGSFISCFEDIMLKDCVDSIIPKRAIFYTSEGFFCNKFTVVEKCIPNSYSHDDAYALTFIATSLLAAIIFSLYRLNIVKNLY